jgi:dTDP-4-amino-4,6-dideoxygalactose transaminase
LGVSMFLHKICFPSVSASKNTKGIIVHHQYGFPQNMDEILAVAKENNWFVIENCVNVYESFYKGQRVGTFGTAAFFSLAKMFPLPQGGALVSGNPDLVSYARRSIAGDHSSLTSNLWYLSRVMNEYGESKFWQRVQVMAESLTEYVKRISPSSLNIARKDVSGGAMKRRQDNYHFLLDYFKDYDFFQNLERDVIPYVVPLITREGVQQKIRSKLLASGIWTDFYQFDVNRNLLNPGFKRCVWVPMHQGIDQDNMERICKLIKEAI